MRIFFPYILVGFFCFCFAPNLSASDTLLFNIFELPHNIINLVSDEDCSLYFSDKIGAHRFYRDGKTELIDPNFHDELLIESGQLYLYEDREREYSKILQYWENQNLVWKDRVFNFNLNHQLSNVIDGQWVWVAFKNNIYQFLILENAKIHLPSHSTRVLYLVDSNLIVGTYKGLYLNNELLDFCHLDGFALAQKENFYLGTGGHIYKLDFSEKYISLFRGELDFFSSHQKNNLNFTTIFEHSDNSLLLGTDKGLLELDANWNFVQFDLEHLVIEYIGDFGDDIWICTSEGMYRKSAQKGYSKVDLKMIDAPNHFLVTDERLLIAASNGLFEFSLDEPITSNPKKISLDSDLIEFHRIEEGKPGEFWVSSEKGLHLYRPNLSSMQRIYKEYEFNKRASFNAFPTIYFGGLFGVLEINASGLSKELDEVFAVEDRDESTEYFTLILVFIGLTLISFFVVYFLLRKHKKGLFTQVFQPAVSETEDLSHPIVLKEACERVIDQKLPTITVEILAQKLGINARTLNRRLSIIGSSAGELIREQRLKLIEQELKKSTDETDIEQLANLTGYSEVHINSLIKSIKSSPKF